jgi:hypothetical protein
MRPVEIGALIALGAFHGANPAMGWLFAVARGMQERDYRALLRALPPIALGHLASVAAVAVAVSVTGSVVASSVLAIAGGLLLVGFGLWRLLSQRHFRWVGMSLSNRELINWSFLMSSAHGAGLMLLPVLVIGVSSPHHHGLLAAAPSAAGTTTAALNGLAAVAIHTLAMFLVATTIALLVYRVVGLGVLRHAWFNLDRMWAAVLITAGLATLATAT